MKLVPGSWRSRVVVVLSSVAMVAGVVVAGAVVAGPASADNRVTPGNFTGYGFDQCVAPTQTAMDRWLTSSPYWAVGIYISGDSRGCVSQPNLTPAWVSAQLGNGWRLLPLTVGPQASCTTRERYLGQVRISPDPARDYAAARRQGRQEAAKTVLAASGLGISARSTLWYDLEAFDTSGTRCRESALSFLSGWTNKLHELGYVSGVYSSAASVIRMLDDANTSTPGAYAMPDQVWIADWNGRADLSSAYVRAGSWMPHARVHQYQGPHTETHDGVSIEVDSNYLSLGQGSVAPAPIAVCGGVQISYRDYYRLQPGDTGPRVPALQCLLRRNGTYTGPITGSFDDPTHQAVLAYQQAHGLTGDGVVTTSTWTAILSQGTHPVLKYGSASRPVRRVQRALNAAVDAHLPITGLYYTNTATAVTTYQRAAGLPPTGIVTDTTWTQLERGEAQSVEPQPAPQADFTISSYNVLGSSHTIDSTEYASGTTRIKSGVALLASHDTDLVGFNELQRDQLAAFLAVTDGQYGIYPGAELLRRDINNSIAWDTSTWDLVEKRTFDIPYFDGKMRAMPIVLLRHKETGLLSYFVNVHNPATNRKHPDSDPYRVEATNIEIDLVNELARSGLPVVLLGDMNERAYYFCRMTGEAPMRAARGGTNVDGVCDAQRPVSVSWIFGSNPLGFSNYVEDETAREQMITDHRVLFSDVQIDGAQFPAAVSAPATAR
jgi:peptidoglycan hydrolase-like protein with peptidoglycan-binding domain